MSGMIRDARIAFVTLVLCVFSNAHAAPGQTPQAYLSAKPLVLEVRYCECAATDLDGSPSALLPTFFETSNLLKVGASGEQDGFVSSDGFSMGYEIKRIEGGPARFLFTYAAEYAIDNGANAGHGEVLVNEDQWVYLFGSSHTTGTGSESTGVAVRITNHKP